MSDIKITPEEFAELRGEISALTNLCSTLIATHTISGNLITIFKSQVSREHSRTDQTTIDKAFVKGFASVLPELEAAASLVADADRIASLSPEGHAH